ncbi:MAG: hypothetical protein U0104_11240 [Gemmatimonadales bacterium]|nr:hypothetical protein [Gemmatimonadales bacterium]
MSANWATRTGAVWFALWGLLHVLGAGLQLRALASAGGPGLTAMIASGLPFDPAANPVPDPAAAFMGMGAFNLLWIGLLVTGIAVTLNWRNSTLGFWLNVLVVGATDLGLVMFLLTPGVMAWGDGSVGLGLFLLAVAFSGAGRWQSTRVAALRLGGA